MHNLKKGTVIIMELFLRFIFALALTEAVEIPLAFGLRAVCVLPRDLSHADTLIPAALVNLLTNPLLNFILLTVNYFWGTGKVYFSFLAAGEIAVLVGEALLFRGLYRVRLIRAAAVSLILNTASFLAGIVFSSMII